MNRNFVNQKNRMIGIFLLIVSIGLMYGMIECGAFESNAWHGYTIIDHFPKYTSISLITIIFLLSFIIFFTGRVSSAILIASTLSMILGLVNLHMFHYHGALFVKADLLNVKTAGNVISAYGLIVNKYSAVILFLYFLNVLISVYLRKKSHFDLFFSQWKTRFASLLIMTVIMFFVYFSPNSIMPNLSAGQGFNWDFLYARYGVIPTFVNNLQTEFGKVIRPDGYSSDFLVPSKTRTDDSVAITSEYPDIILILNETYYDLNLVTDPNPNVNFMSNYESLTNCIKGYATIQGVGGGTNGSEYQLLTSNSLALIQSGSPFTNMSMAQQHSICDYLETLGYISIAAHPGDPSSYRRASAWAELGFDKFFFEDQFEDKEYYGDRTQFVTDESAILYFIDYMNSMDSTKPHFGYLLTIQNHGGWTNNSDEDNIVHSRADYSYSEEVSSQIDEYLSCVYLSDQSIRLLIDKLTECYEENGRKYIVCMVGDHGPSFINSIQTGGITDAQVKMRQTPYFIWANYPISDIGDYKEIDICDLVPLVLKIAEMPLSVYYSKLIDLAKEGVVSNTNFLIASDGDAASLFG